MTVIYITDNNCKCYAVTFQNNGFVQVQKFEDVSEIDKNIIYSINPMETFLGNLNLVLLQLCQVLLIRLVLMEKLLYLK